jgi:hypothetical protein
MKINDSFKLLVVCVSVCIRILDKKHVINFEMDFEAKWTVNQFVCWQFFLSFILIENSVDDLVSG